MRKRFIQKRFMRKGFIRKGFIRQFLQNVTAMAVTIFAGSWAVRYAYDNRGYFAAGGEYLFIPFVFLGTYVGCNWLFDILEEIHWRRNLEKQLTPTDHEDKGVTEKC